MTTTTALVALTGLVACAWLLVVATWWAQRLANRIPQPSATPRLPLLVARIPAVSLLVKHRPFGPLESDDHRTTAGPWAPPALPPGPPLTPLDTAELVLGDIPDPQPERLPVPQLTLIDPTRSNP